MSSAVKNFAMRQGAWVLLGLTLLLVLVVRVRLRDMPLERDEGEYAYAGQLILHGIPPYGEVYNMKLPGTYAAYAAIMALFGQTPAGIHLGVMLVNLASIVLVFLLGRQLLDSVTGIATAAIFALMSLSPYVLGLAGHATHFVTFFALAGTLVLVRACGEKAESGKQKAESGNSGTGGEKAESGVEGHASRITHHASRITLPAAGLLFGLAFLMKQHGIFFGLFGLLYLVWTEWRGERRAANVGGRTSNLEPRTSNLERRTSNPHHSITPSLQHSSTPSPHPSIPPSLLFSVAGISAGFLLPYAATCLVLWAAGVFPAFWFWTVSYAAKYASSISAMYSADMLRNGLRAVVGPNLGLWLLPWAGALVMWWEERLEGGNPKSETRNPKQIRSPKARNPSPEEGITDHASRLPPPASRITDHESRITNPASRITDPASRITDHASRITDHASRIPHPRFFLTAFFFCSFASISVGFYFREHYFITLLPALALLSGVAVSRALHLLRQDQTIELFLAVAILLLFVTGLGAALLGNSAFWFQYSPEEAVKYSYGTSLFCDAVSVGDYLRTHTPPSARVAILGSEPEILFYAGRRSATGYIYTYPLMERQAFAGAMQQQMIAQIERARPEYAVFIDDNYSWLPQAHSDRKLLDWWGAYWPAQMDVVLTRAIQGKAELTAEAFPTQDAPDRPPDQRFLLVLKRKSDQPGKPPMDTDKHR